jgi:nucleoid-associated protein YgaU
MAVAKKKKTVKRAAKKPVKKTVKRAAKRPVKKTAKRAAKRPVKKTAKRAAKKTVKKAVKKSAKKAVKKAVAKKPAAKKVVKAAAAPAPKPAPAPAVRPPTPVISQPPKIKAWHVVSSGDTPSMISQKYYGTTDQSKWMAIYEVNKAAIGPDPNQLRPGMVLRIPEA